MPPQLYCQFAAIPRLWHIVLYEKSFFQLLRRDNTGHSGGGERQILQRWICNASMDTSGQGYDRSSKCKVKTLSQEHHQKTKSPTFEVNYLESTRSYVWWNVSANTMESKKGL